MKTNTRKLLEDLIEELGYTKDDDTVWEDYSSGKKIVREKEFEYLETKVDQLIKVLGYKWDRESKMLTDGTSHVVKNNK